MQTSANKVNTLAAILFFFFNVHKKILTLAWAKLMINEH